MDTHTILSDSVNPTTAPELASEHIRPHWYGWLALLSIGPLGVLLLKAFGVSDQPEWHNPLAHLLIVGSVSLLGIGLALLTLKVAYRASDARVFFVGMGFLSIASILVVHSVATPDVVMTGRVLATSWSAPLSLVFGAMFFALSGLDFSAATNQQLMRHARTWLLLYVIFWLAYSGFFLVVIPSIDITASTSAVQVSVTPSTGPIASDPGAHLGNHEAYSAETPAVAQQLAATPVPFDSIRIFVVVIGLLCYTYAAGSHYYFYHRSPSHAGLGITCGIVLFGEALLTQQLSRAYSPMFWLYHLEEFAGFGVISYALLVAYHYSQSGENMLENLLLPGTRAQLQADYSQAINALIETLTHGGQPAPMLSQTLRERFGLTERQLRVVEQAALAVNHERQQRQELEKLNDALRQVERDRDQLVQMVVHDLKNPLTALLGFLEIMCMTRLDNEQLILLNSALRSGKNLSGLVGDLLDIGRIEEGHLDLLHSYFSLPDLFQECASEMSVWLSQDDKTLQIETPDDLPLLYADLRLVRRILLNLISNAIKHTPTRTRIILRAYTSPSANTPDRTDMIVEVEDNGPGIAPEDIGRVFAKYGRLKSQETSRQESTGLGLTFCRLAVEAHGGSISVISALQKGTTFRFIFQLPEAEFEH